MYGPIRSCLSRISNPLISPRGFISTTPSVGIRKLVLNTDNSSRTLRCSPPKAKGFADIISSNM